MRKTIHVIASFLFTFCTHTDADAEIFIHIHAIIFICISFSFFKTSVYCLLNYYTSMSLPIVVHNITGFIQFFFSTHCRSSYVMLCSAQPPHVYGVSLCPMWWIIKYGLIWKEKKEWTFSTTEWLNDSAREAQTEYGKKWASQFHFFPSCFHRKTNYMHINYATSLKSWIALSEPLSSSSLWHFYHSTVLFSPFVFHPELF